jgi:hypothetical protein
MGREVRLAAASIFLFTSARQPALKSEVGISARYAGIDSLAAGNEGCHFSAFRHIDLPLVTFACPGGSQDLKLRFEGPETISSVAIFESVKSKRTVTATSLPQPHRTPF